MGTDTVFLTFLIAISTAITYNVPWAFQIEKLRLEFERQMKAIAEMQRKQAGSGSGVIQLDEPPVLEVLRDAVKLGSFDGTEVFGGVKES